MPTCPLYLLPQPHHPQCINILTITFLNERLNTLYLPLWSHMPIRPSYSQPHHPSLNEHPHNGFRWPPVTYHNSMVPGFPYSFTLYTIFTEIVISFTSLQLLKHTRGLKPRLKVKISCSCSQYTCLFVWLFGLWAGISSLTVASGRRSKGL